MTAPGTRWWVAMLALLLAAGCNKSCAEGGQKGGAAQKGPVPTREWLEGVPPASMFEGTPRKGGTLVIRISSEPAGLNRLHDQQRDGNMVRYTTGTVLETLFELDRETAPRYELKPLLAESYTESEDHLTHTFKLRKGVHFHDGQPFTAKDVKAVMDAVMNPKNLTVQARAQFVNLAKYETPDDYTVVLRWKVPDYLGFRSFSSSMPIAPASALKGDFSTLPYNRAPVGTGPFKFESWETGKSITFVRNDAYWGTPAYLDKLQLRIVKDETVAAQLWERGEFDLMTKILPSMWRAVEAPEPQNAWAIQGYNRLTTPQNNFSFIGYNEERPFFKDKRVRKAMAMLYPYERVAKNLEMGLEPRTTCPFLKGSANCDPEVEAHPITYDPAGAKKLLEEAGWKDTNGDGVLEKDGVPFRFTFLVTAQSVKAARLVPLIQEELRKAGIDVEIEKVEWAIYSERLLKHQFDVAVLIWVSQDVEQDQFQVFHSSQTQGSNYVSFSNPEVDRLTLAARAEFDAGKRAEINKQLHRILYEEQPYTFLTTRPDFDAAKVDVRGLRPALNFYDLRKVWLARDGAQPPPK